MSDQYNPYGGQPTDPYGGQPQQNPYAQPQADPYAQQNPYAQPQANPYAQQNPYAQPQADPYAQQNPYAQPQADPYADPYGQGNPYQAQGMAAPATKKSKAPIIITICVVLAAAIAVGVYFLFIKKDKDGGSDKAGNTPKDVVVAFVDAFENYDTDKIASLFPPELASDQEVQSLKQMFELYKSMGVIVKFKDPKYDIGDDYSETDLEQLRSTLESQGYYISDKVKNAKNVTIKCKIETTYSGQTETQDYNATLIVSKIDGEWKILAAYQ
ncbi:MAG: hypothetical protein IJJ74_00715 [Eubacterium sp.]|nr:hypothetical protein [Eubacterium sp.]